jgi:hypothetical protein
MNKILAGVKLLKNMGLRYMLFRVFHVISKRTGFFERRFPTSSPCIDAISLNTWKNKLPPFFFQGKNILNLRKQELPQLKDLYSEISQGIITFFGKTKYNLGSDYDWVTNPVTGYKYDINQHWSCMDELSEESGDIKFVWEKARFNFIFDIIRFDYHFKTDCSDFVFKEINSFIDKNPLNQGPNYICSQEISLRIINWTFALYYYKDSDALTESLFEKIINSIYWQIHHVYQNINFSKIAVRNNHALTETLLLYLSGLLFPFLPDVKIWSQKGKKWFEQEIAYQIYEDGTYLQFSNNYHRVVIQLVTVGMQLARLNGKKFDSVVYSRSKKSLEFLYNSMEISTGMLPNYGSNDGALFFKLNDQDFRDFRPQLQAFSYAISDNNVIELNGFNGEDIYWLGLSERNADQTKVIQNYGISSYPVGGFYIIRDNETMTYIRCGKHRDRPAHADNLHIDIWYKGVNVLRDNGSYLYNSEPEMLRYFMGTHSHNTIMLDNYDQMLKGPRFIWFDWSQALNTEFKEFDTQFEFTGSISAFRYLGKEIKHRRKVIKIKGFPRWIIEDEILGTNRYNMNQLWHFDPDLLKSVKIQAKDLNGTFLESKTMEGWYSSYYGKKEASDYYMFSTAERKITTEIEIIQ